jgi:DNA-binding transcriptional LysR family regulator
VSALEELRGAHSGLVLLVTTLAPGDLPALLRRGLVDIAFHGPTTGLDGFETVNLGDATNAVYCGPGHPLHGRRRVTPERLTAHAFVAPPADASGQCVDGWPVGVPRTVAMQVDQLRVGLEICLRGGLLAVLPDDLVAEHALAGSLWRLPFPGIADDVMFATHRRTLGFTTRAEVVLASVREVLRRRAGRRVATHRPPPPAAPRPPARKKGAAVPARRR